MKLRLVKYPQFYALHHVQKKTWLGWSAIFSGSLQECEEYLKTYPVKVIKEIEV